jgi:hypothetical protein
VSDLSVAHSGWCAGILLYLCVCVCVCVCVFVCMCRAIEAAARARQETYCPAALACKSPIAGGEEVFKYFNFGEGLLLLRTEVHESFIIIIQPLCRAAQSSDA